MLTRYSKQFIIHAIWLDSRDYSHFTIRIALRSFLRQIDEMVIYSAHFDTSIEWVV